MISGFLALLSTSSARLTAAGGRNLGRRRVDDLDQRLLPGLRIHHLTEQLGRQIEIDAARTAGDGRADRARQADADVGGMQHAEGRLAQRLGDGELVHLLVVALLQVDDLALGRARDQDHRKAVGRGVGERDQTVEKAGRRHREADAGLFGQIAGDGRRVAGVLLVPERDDADACGLRHAAEVRDRDAGHAVDRLDVVELHRIDDEMKAVRQLAFCFGRGRRFLFLYCCISHGNPPLRPVVGSVSPNSRHNAPRDRQGRARGRARVLPRDRWRALPEPR